VQARAGEPVAALGRLIRVGRGADQQGHAPLAGKARQLVQALAGRGRDLDGAGVIRVVVESLYDAADDDAATGGPDLTRGIYPVVMLATAAGTSRVTDDELDTVVRAILADREARPGA